MFYNDKQNCCIKNLKSLSEIVLSVDKVIKSNITIIIGGAKVKGF